MWARFSRTGPAWWAEGRRSEVVREGTEGQWSSRAAMEEAHGEVEDSARVSDGRSRERVDGDVN